MSIFAVRRGDESADRLQSRFKSQVQESRIIKLLRDRRVHRRKLTQRLQRLRALKREEYRAQSQKKKFYSNM